MIARVVAWLIGSRVGRGVLLAAGALALLLGALGAKAVYDRGRRREGREAERKERLRNHVDAIEAGRRAEADAGSGSPRARRLRRKYRRD